MRKNERMKIVKNCCYGGFSLSHKAIMRYAEIKGIKLFVENNGFSGKNYYKVDPKQYKECSEKWYKEDGNYKRINAKDWYFSAYSIERTDEILIQVIEELGKEANGDWAELQIVEIPDGTQWEIDDYDGIESIDEVHNSW